MTSLGLPSRTDLTPARTLRGSIPKPIRSRILTRNPTFMLYSRRPSPLRFQGRLANRVLRAAKRIQRRRVRTVNHTILRPFLRTINGLLHHPSRTMVPATANSLTTRFNRTRIFPPHRLNRRYLATLLATLNRQRLQRQPIRQVLQRVRITRRAPGWYSTGLKFSWLLGHFVFLLNFTLHTPSRSGRPQRSFRQVNTTPMATRASLRINVGYLNTNRKYLHNRRRFDHFHHRFAPQF